MQRDYPMLECCRVVLRPETAVDRPPVRLPADIMSKISVPKPYDFSLEREILKKKEDRDQEWALTMSDSREELQQNILARMKSVTNASEDVCISLLESNSYDLKVAVEAFLSR